ARSCAEERALQIGIERGPVAAPYRPGLHGAVLRLSRGRRRREGKRDNLAMLSLLAALIAAATPPAEIDPEALRRHVAVLASDAFEGRMPGTRGEARTIAYVADQFEK